MELVEEQHIGRVWEEVLDINRPYQIRCAQRTLVQGGQTPSLALLLMNNLETDIHIVLLEEYSGALSDQEISCVNSRQKFYLAIYIGQCEDVTNFACFEFVRDIRLGANYCLLCFQ
jgi:hypothetical protein